MYARALDLCIFKNWPEPALFVRPEQAIVKQSYVVYSFVHIRIHHSVEQGRVTVLFLIFSMNI